ncbi:MAG: arylsulfatase [Saprospiraceae bacterium]|nr:arylsulfatase [Saprospiraceae bacterium]
MVLSCQSAPKSDKKEHTQPPNIIFIMADDLGYGDIGPYGQEKIKTPFLDQLAAEGMRFTQHYAGTAVCAPSRSVLMTGLHTGHTEIRGNKQFPPGDNGQQPLSDSIQTLAEALQSAGYYTALIGKWGLGNVGTTGEPSKQGFDHYFGYLDQVLAHNYFPDHLIRNGERVELENEVQYLDTSFWHKGLGSYATVKRQYSHDLLLQEALEIIRTKREQPLFLYLPITIPHDNGEAPKGERMEVPSQGIYATKDWGKDEKDYAAMITRMDEGIGRILSLLQDEEIDENTILFFTSDNGPMPGESFTEFFDSNGPLRGGKRDLYEGGIRVPLIVRWPGKIQAGITNDHLSAFWDIFPTCLDLAQQQVPDGLDGLSLLPSLLGKGDQAEHSSLYWEFHERTGAQAIRQGKWKAVKNNAITNPAGAIELYDLSADIAEEHNLAAEYPDKLKELSELIRQSRYPSDLFPRIQ